MNAEQILGPGQQHESIARMIGLWVAQETFAPSLRSGSGKRSGRLECQSICNGLFVVGNYAQMGGRNEVTYSGLGVFGVDPTTQEVTWYWFDSLGGMPYSPARGGWNGDTLVLVGRDEHGRPNRHYTFAFEGYDRLRFVIEDAADDGLTWHTFMDARCLKTAP